MQRFPKFINLIAISLRYHQLVLVLTLRSVMNEIMVKMAAQSRD